MGAECWGASYRRTPLKVSLIYSGQDGKSVEAAGARAWDAWEYS